MYYLVILALTHREDATILVLKGRHMSTMTDTFSGKLRVTVEGVGTVGIDPHASIPLWQYAVSAEVTIPTRDHVASPATTPHPRGLRTGHTETRYELVEFDPKARTLAVKIIEP
jgi:hypothetical protein